MDRPWALPGVTGRTVSEQFERNGMLRWLIVVLLILIVFSGLQPWLQKLGFGRLPGDFRFRLFRREWFLPITSTLLLSLLASLVVKWL